MKAKLNQKFNKEINHVHFIGIGGISMSGLAEILRNKGFTVSGSDREEKNTTRHLSSLGVDIKFGHKAENITDEMDLIVYTAAIKPDNPAFAAAKQKDIPMLDRAQLLGLIMDDYENSIAVAGVHGKTTTTSIVTEVLLAAGLDPTISIGGFVESIGSNLRIGNSSYFLAEACEYADSFLQFRPKVGVILNIDSDHMDYFGTFERLVDSFKRFAKNIPEDGTLIVHSSCANQVIDGLKCKVIVYGEGSQIWAKDIKYNSDVQPSFTIMDKQNALADVNLKLRGAHNIDNCLAVAAVANVLDIPIEATVKGLQIAVGAKRRFEHKGEYNGITIVDDYSHHPTEVKAGLASASKNKRLICAFQPHTYTRTQYYLEEFGKSFEAADVVLILPTYAAREEPIGPEVNYMSKMLCDEIAKNGKQSLFFDDFSSAAEWIKLNVKPGDLLITMGAGDINVLGEGLISGDL